MSEENLSPEKTEILLCVYDGQRTESLQHRASIFNAFSLAMAGLLAVLAAVVAVDELGCSSKWIVGLAIVGATILIGRFIRRQRIESNKAMEIMREIETHLGLFEPGAFLTGKRVLPSEHEKPPTLYCGLKPADWELHIAPMIFMAAAICVVLILVKGK